MPESHAVRALKAKRSELTAELAQLEIHRRSIRKRLKSLDDTIRLMGGEQSAPIPHGRKRRWIFRRGELQRLVCGVLREADGQIADRDVARAVVAQMDWDTGDDDLLRVVCSKVHDVRKRLNASWFRQPNRSIGACDSVWRATKKTGN